jgi:hypothetical protein
MAALILLRPVAMRKPGLRITEPPENTGEQPVECRDDGVAFSALSCGSSPVGIPAMMQDTRPHPASVRPARSALFSAPATQSNHRRQLRPPQQPRNAALPNDSPIYDGFTDLARLFAAFAISPPAILPPVQSESRDRITAPGRARRHRRSDEWIRCAGRTRRGGMRDG